MEGQRLLGMEGQRGWLSLVALSCWQDSLAPSKKARGVGGEADVGFNERNTSSRSDRIGSDPDTAFLRPVRESERPERALLQQVRRGPAAGGAGSGPRHAWPAGSFSSAAEI